MASTEHAEHATLALAQKICLHLRLISSVLQTEVPFHKDAFLQVKILTEDEKLLHERSIGDGDAKIGKGVLCSRIVLLQTNGRPLSVDCLVFLS